MLGVPLEYSHEASQGSLPDGVAATPEEVDTAIRQYFMEGQHPLPPGCEPDAVKLFVGNIPKHLTEQQLRPVFECIGPVVRLSVVSIVLRLIEFIFY
jgi:RNA recognition motif-containing protein